MILEFLPVGVFVFMTLSWSLLFLMVNVSWFVKVWFLCSLLSADVCLFGFWHCSNLSGFNLDGEISPAIGNLKDLLTVYCSFSLSSLWNPINVLYFILPLFLSFLLEIILVGSLIGNSMFATKNKYIFLNYPHLFF